MQTIYEPKGKAKEYGELALNIYTGCTHACTYCYAPNILRRDRSDFHVNVNPRENILEETKKRLSKGDIKGKEIFLCFTCDPFPNGIDSSVTYETIKVIKESGNHVAILTKGNIDIDMLFSLLDCNDRFGVTLSCSNEIAKKQEPNAASVIDRIFYIRMAKLRGIKTFVSFEPVLQPSFIYQMIENEKSIDEYRIGKLNYNASYIDWKEFGKTCEHLCKTHRKKYLIKEGLRAEMEKQFD